MAKTIYELIEKAIPELTDELEIQEGSNGDSYKATLGNLLLTALTNEFPELTITLGGETAPSQAVIDNLVNNYGFLDRNILWADTSNPQTSESSSPSESVSSSPSSTPSSSPSVTPSSSVSSSPSITPSSSPSNTPSTSVSSSPSTTPSSSPSSTPSSSPSASGVEVSHSVSSSPSNTPSSSVSSSPSITPSSSPSNSPSSGGGAAPTGLSASNISNNGFTLSWNSSPEIIALYQYETMGAAHGAANTILNWRPMWALSSETWDPDIVGYSGGVIAYDDTGGEGDSGIVRLLLAFPIPTDLENPSNVVLNLNCNTAYGGTVRVVESSVTTPLGTATDFNTTNHDTNAVGSIDTSTTGLKSIDIPVSWVTAKKGSHLVMCLRVNTYDSDTQPDFFPGDGEFYGAKFDVIGGTTPAYLGLAY